MADPYLGEIRMFAFGTRGAPLGWQACDGSLLPISENDALFALIGTTYGGDGQTTFAVPDLRGRLPIHQGAGPGLSNYVIGQRAGIQIDRERIVEVGNLASDRAGGSLDIILHMARHLHRAGFEWVVFTATQQLIGIFTKLGLPLLALSVADATRLGDAANDWGSYYETQPIVVTGPIRLAIERMRSGA